MPVKALWAILSCGVVWSKARPGERDFPPQCKVRNTKPQTRISLHWIFCLLHAPRFVNSYLTVSSLTTLLTKQKIMAKPRSEASDDFEFIETPAAPTPVPPAENYGVRTTSVGDLVETQHKDFKLTASSVPCHQECSIASRWRRKRNIQYLPSHCNSDPGTLVLCAPARRRSLDYPLLSYLHQYSYLDLLLGHRLHDLTSQE